VPWRSKSGTFQRQRQLRNTKLPVLNCAATTARMKVFEGNKDMRKVSPTSSLWLMLFFGGVLVLAIVVTLIWHFFSFGKAL
jgi:hypothetical protein